MGMPDFLRAFLVPIQDLISDPSVSEIAYNGDQSAHPLWIERGGRMVEDARPLAADTVVNLISVLARSVGREVKSAAGPEALLDARMEGFRVAAVLTPVALHGPVFSVRRHAERRIPLASYFPEDDPGRPAPIFADPSDAVSLATRTDILDWTGSLLTRPVNVIVSGGTSTGKTSFINSLIGGIPADERVLTLEDTAELRVEVPNWVALEAHPDNGLTLRHLVRMALRLRPDRILVGEVRGAEAFDLMQALNTGHSGAATLHANSATEALHRLETLVLTANVGWPPLAIRKQISRTIDYVVQLTRSKGRREVSEVIALRGADDEGSYLFDRLWPPDRSRRATSVSPTIVRSAP